MEARGKEFLSTAFDLGSLGFLDELGPERFKIPSGEITNLPYLRAIAGYAEHIIMSTGMATWRMCGGRRGDHGNGLLPQPCHGAAVQHGVPKPDRRREPPGDGHVGRADLGVAIGYSDHTEGALPRSSRWRWERP